MSAYAICGASEAPLAGFWGWSGMVGAAMGKKPLAGLYAAFNRDVSE
jgi:hypothetical protein